MKKVEEAKEKKLVDEAEAKRLVDEAEAKWEAEEVEAKKKEDELLKQHQLQDLSQTPNTPSTPNLGIVNMPPQDYTPLNVILGDSSFSSQALNFEGTVVAIGDYYYDNKMRSIEKRSNKRKRGEDTRSKSSAGRILEWKVGPDPEENVVQEASALHTFAGLNALSILEVASSLNTAKTRVTELETELRDVKYRLTSEFENAARVVDTLNTKNLNRSLQAQRDQMNAEFEIMIKTQWDTHNRELEAERQKLKTTMEENKTSTLVVDTIKTQALELNERFATEQKEFLNLLGNIQTGREEQLRLQDKLVEIQGRYQESHEALEKMLGWKDMCETPPTTLPVYSDRERL
jgi:hypothetical protein